MNASASVRLPKRERPSKPENTLQAHTLAAPAQRTPSSTPDPESGHVSPPSNPGTHDRAIDREWARLEGMAEAVGNEAIVGQVAKLRALIAEGSA